MRRLLRDSSSLALGLLSAQVCTALTYWLVARSLRPAQLGSLLAAVGLARLVAAVADFGMNSSTVRSLARDPTDTRSFSAALASKVLLALVLGSGWVLLSVAGALARAWPATFVVAGPFISFEVIANTLEVPLRAARRMATVSLLMIADAVLALLITAAALRGGCGAELALLAGLSGASALVVAGSWLLVEPRFRTTSCAGLADLWRTWRESLDFGMVALTTQIQRADVAVVAAVAGPGAAGLFAVPARLAGPLSLVPHACSTALYPRVAGSRHRGEAHGEVVRGVLLLLCLMGCALAGLFLFARPVVSSALGPQYLPSVRVLRVYLVGALLAAVNQPMAVFLQAEGQERFVSRVVTPACAAGLAGIALGAAAQGAFGAAFGFVLLHVIAGSLLGVRCCQMVAGCHSVRQALHPMIWRLLAPVRWYLRQSRCMRGKGLLSRCVLAPLLPPPPAAFVATFPGRARVRLGYRETLGLSTLVNHGFETAELECAAALTRPGAVAIDVGANVGIWSISLARAVQPDGLVWAFEPLESNARRLRENMALNRTRNIDVHCLAVGSARGEVELLVADDPAYASTTGLAPSRRAVGVQVVPVVALDDVWRAAGSPDVSVVKVDVEGGELGVLRGAATLLEACRPALFVEAATQRQVLAVTACLRPLGYHRRQPPGFMTWNHLFLPARTARPA